ncbi:hypothetical protein [Leptospira bouyouniensis]|uniref:hypothetical protein n=1 Tax=Leptospira bouyouniensis TaxID=2484911 RepID=UPI0010913BE2|nr:hypothetical protein [Leptospira bouyouniensis]
MTILEVIKFFLKYSDLSFRPAHVANLLVKPEKTIYRCLGILSRESILCESHGLYWLHQSATVKPGIPPKKGCPIILAILLTLLTGQAFNESELEALFQRKLTRAINKLGKANLINRTSPEPLFPNTPKSIWLEVNYSLPIGRSQFSRNRMGELYGK